MGCILNIIGIGVALAIAAVIMMTLFKVFLFSVSSLAIALAIGIALYFLIVKGFNIASWAGVKAVKGINESAKALARAAGIDDASKVDETLKSYRVEGEEKIIGNTGDWAEKLINYLDKRGDVSFDSSSSIEADYTAEDKGTLKSRMQECILAKDALILRLQRAGKLDENTDLAIAVTNSMNRLMAQFKDMRVFVTSWRNNKSTIQKTTHKLIKYEHALVSETDPQVIRSLKSAIRGCLESLELIKSGRTKVKVFSLRLEMVTTKYENLAHLLLERGSLANSSILDELDDLADEIVSGKASLAESLEEIELDLGDVDSAENLGEKDMQAIRKIHEEASKAGELFESDFFNEI